MINILCTSAPCDGLFYYSYEHFRYLKEIGIACELNILTYRNHKPEEYIKSITDKYICDNLDGVCVDKLENLYDFTFVLGRSMVTLGYEEFNKYTLNKQIIIRNLLLGSLISVYSENHPIKYYDAVNFFKPLDITDLCDTEVYPNGVGTHFEKNINFSIYKEFETNIEFKYLFNGSNKRYYNTIKKIIHKYNNHGILTYDHYYLDENLNNIKIPIDNLLGKFDTYVYIKETFDPAPRIIQECKYFNKPIIYERDKNIIDGGSVYYNRETKCLTETKNINTILDIIL